MNDLYDDESTDEEFGVDLQLTERLRINRGESSSQDMKFENSKEFKQYCNMRQKERCTYLNGASSSSSFEACNDAPTSETPSQYLLPNKKRQNVDKSQDQSANPKRTCLSDRLSKSSNLKHNISHNNGEYQHSFKVSYPNYLYPETYRSERNLSPDKTYELDLGLPASDDSDSDIAPRYYNKLSKQKAEIFNSVNSHPSSSHEGMNSFKSKCPSGQGVRFVESDSDESSKSPLQNGALKGGSQSPDYVHYSRKVIGRRNKKVLDSDDTEDENWHIKYRNRPIYFSSSESEDSRLEADFKSTLSKDTTANHSISYINKSSCICPDQSQTTPQSCQSSSFNYNGASQMHLAPTSCQYENKGVHNPIGTQSFKTCHKSCQGATYPSYSNSDIGFSPSQSTSSSHCRGRSYRKRGVRLSHRSDSPHPQIIHNHCVDKAQSSMGHRTRSLRVEDNKLDLLRSYPDLFDAEDSSEVEFFTANSYSDTETSNESACGPKVNAGQVNDSRTGLVCDHNTNVGTSEDEISVIYSTASRSCSGDKRNSSAIRGRRYTRGRARNRVRKTPDVVSLSPDPVEQVRQMEEDERFARVLQAQYDAEVDPDYTPSSSANSFLFNSPTNNGDEVRYIEPTGDSETDRFAQFPPSSADSDEEIIDPVGDCDSVGFPSPALSVPSSPFTTGTRRPGGIMNLYSRGRLQSFAPRLLLFQNRRSRSRSRNRRRYSSSQHDPWMWQFTHMLGLSHAIASSGLDTLENDYEALLELAEVNGDAIQKGLQKAEINRLPTRTYHPPNSARSSSSVIEVMHKRAELNKECQVCLDDYKTGDVLRILPCFHEFHTPCIDPWLKINHTCPVCRVIIDLGE